MQAQMLLPIGKMNVLRLLRAKTLTPWSKTTDMEDLILHCHDHLGTEIE